MTLYENSIRLLKQRIKMIKPSKFNFVFLGDSWVGNDNRISVLAQILRNAVKQNPLFIIHGGDIVFAGANASQYTQFINLVTNKDPKNLIPGIGEIPFFVVPGNHETNGIGGNLANFHKFIGPDHFNLNSVLPSSYLTLIGLNNINRVYLTEEEKKNRKLDPKMTYWQYVLNQENLTFLQNSLKGNSARTFVAMHVPPYYGPLKKFGLPQVKGNVTGTADPGTFIRGWGKMKTIIKGKAKNLLFSHVHSYDHFKETTGSLAGVNFTLSGGAGARREKPIVPFHYVLITIDNVQKRTIYKPVFLPSIKELV